MGPSKFIGGERAKTFAMVVQIYTNAKSAHGIEGVVLIILVE